MRDRILVTYATRTGFTTGVAEEIGRVMASDGVTVEVLPISAVTSLAPYRAVIAGSAIQNKQWLPEAMEFVRANRAALNAAPFAAFLDCMTLCMGNGKYRGEVATWLQPVRGLVRPVSEGLFAGGLDIRKIPSASNRLKFRISVLTRVWSEGDYRDWDAIRAWAGATRPLLLG